MKDEFGGRLLPDPLHRSAETGLLRLVDQGVREMLENGLAAFFAFGDITEDRIDVGIDASDPEMSEKTARKGVERLLE